MAQTSRSALRKFILSLPIDGELRLTSGVSVQAHDGSGQQWPLPVVSVYRRGKNGVACVSDNFNYWTVNELTDDECYAILSALPAL